MAKLRFWLRWSWRDLRQRWILVSAIALTIGVGTGAYAGLTSTSSWRNAANDASYRALNMFDVRVRIVDGGGVPAGSLADLVRSIANPGWIADTQERLVLPVQVDASLPDEAILVPGQIIGVNVALGDAMMAGQSARVGRPLGPQDAGADVAVVDYHFAREKHLPPSGTLSISGGGRLTYVGQVLTPEYFLVTTAAGGLFAQSHFAALMTPIDTVQRLTGRPGQVNDVLVRLAPGVDAERARTEIRDAVQRGLPARALSVDLAAEDEAHRVLYRDVDTDQRFYSVFAFVILAGATLAAFNLTSRIVESQRRQIGISMALGLPRTWIAFRPLLVGAQVALLGTVLGVIVGLLIDVGMDSLLQRYFPLPVWSAPFQPAIFAQAAAIGFILPFAACLYPVWRAVSVPPMQAIRTGFLTAGSGGWAPALRRLRLPGGVFQQLPLRNVLRTPRRTILTSLGVAAAVTVFVGTTGLTDTFLRTIDVGQNEVVKGNPDRVIVGLIGYTPTPVALAHIRDTGTAAQTDAGLSIGATATARGVRQSLSIQLLDLEHDQWIPTAVTGRLPRPGAPDGRPEIMLGKAGADELHVAPGDVVTVTHEHRNAGAVETFSYEMVVTGVSPDPLKSGAYMSLGDASLFGLHGLSNVLSVVPVPGRTLLEVQQALFRSPGVASVEAIDSTAQIFRHLVDQYLSLLSIVQYTALVLAILIAFNTATISLDERTRENATMFAFGTRLRTVMGMAIFESAIIGLVGTLLGIAMGRVVLELIVRLVVRDVVPDIGFVITVTPATLLWAAVVGILAVAVAPLLGLPRLRRLDIPNALRVVE